MGEGGGRRETDETKTMTKQKLARRDSSTSESSLLARPLPPQLKVDVEEVFSRLP